MKQLEFSWDRRSATTAPVAAVQPSSAPPVDAAKPAPTPQEALAHSSREDAVELRQDLEERTGLHINLTITNNTSTLMTVRKDRTKPHATLRLHRMFLQAHGATLDALASWVKNPRKRSRDGSLEEFMRENRHQIRKRMLPEATLDTQGTHFDLRELFDEVNRQFFNGTIRARITWGRLPGPPRRRRSIRFGSYVAEENLIRIHPLLDQEFVPRYFVKYIVFHEMLHADVGIKTSASGRRSVHSPEFNRRERAYPEYDRAVAWQNQPTHLRKLLR